MADETTKTINTADEDYIATINQLKSQSVDKAEYERLRTDNKRLLDSIVNGGTEAKVDEIPKLREPQEIRKELFHSESSLDNLTYATKALELRSSLIAKGEADPFLPSGKQIIPTDEDVVSATRVASVLAECVEYADGDNSVFTNELQRRTLDIRVR